MAIDEDSEEDVIEDVYDVTTREDTQLQRAPLQRYVVSYLNGIICYPFGIKYVYKNCPTAFLYLGDTIVKAVQQSSVLASRV